MEPEERHISVVYALADRQEVVKLTVPASTTIAEAVARSKLVEQFPQIAATALNCAVYGRVVETTQTVREGDRIEILRPLLIDPKESRRQAAAISKKKN